MGKVRGIRFSEGEEKQIEQFLEENPMIDFSTLARISILEFIKNPKIKLVPVREPSVKEVANAKSH